MVFRPHTDVKGHYAWSGRMQSYVTVVTDKDFEQAIGKVFGKLLAVQHFLVAED
jgi:hypothetical protein